MNRFDEYTSITKPDITDAEMFEESYHDGDAHQRLYRHINGRWILQAWTGHQRPQKWFEITHAQALEWLDINEWEPEEVKYQHRVYTRSINETRPEFQARVNAAVFELQRK